MASALDLQNVPLRPEPGGSEEPWRGLKRGCCDQWYVLNNRAPRHTVGLASRTLLFPKRVALRLPSCPYVVITSVGSSVNRGDSGPCGWLSLPHEEIHSLPFICTPHRHHCKGVVPLRPSLTAAFESLCFPRQPMTSDRSFHLWASVSLCVKPDQ